MEKKLYDMAKSMEDALDDELHKMNNMDQDDLENIRRKRLEAMKGDQDKRKKWLAQGHGELRDLQARVQPSNSTLSSPTPPHVLIPAADDLSGRISHRRHLDTV